jgi:hypothetical protein
MALTSQVQESYLKVQEKAIALQYKADKLDSEYSSIKALTQLMSERLTGEAPTSQEALQDKVKLVDVSVTVLNRLKESMLSNLPVFAEIDHDIGALQAENQKLERSLLETSHSQTIVATKVNADSPNNCFLKLIPNANDRKLTLQLLNDPTFRLKSNQSSLLTTAWGNAIQAFIDDAQRTSDADGKILPGQPETIATFFCVRSQLVTLYNRLVSVA